MKCRTPLCEYEAYEPQGWVFCAPCQATMTRQVLDLKGIWGIDKVGIPEDIQIQREAAAACQWVTENAEDLVAYRVKELRGAIKEVKGE